MHRTKGDKLVRARLHPVCNNGFFVQYESRSESSGLCLVAMSRDILVRYILCRHTSFTFEMMLTPLRRIISLKQLQPTIGSRVQVAVVSLYLSKTLLLPQNRCKWVKVQTFQNPELSKLQILKLAVCPLNIHNFKFKCSVVIRQTENKSEKLL